MRRGVRIGVDVGSVRVGVATCDPDGVLATPVETVLRDPAAADLARIARLTIEHAAMEVIVGLPRTLSGREGQSAQAARAYAQALAAHVAPCPVRLVDERLSTVAATRGMQAGGVSARRGRGTVDQAAAVVILQAALDTERGSGRPPGEIVQVDR
ncbi:MAG TPA: Holliday junction resolvase RuvX [Jiangellaceae bacterium]|nr:Holliday junction resolvase RuvX [Jiangellaceae bacterium]